MANTIQEAEKAGAGFIQGCGQWRAGRGRIVTEWCNTQEEAAKEFLRLYREGVADA